MIDFYASGSPGKILQPAFGHIRRHFPLCLGKPISAKAFQMGLGTCLDLVSDRLLSSLTGAIGHFNNPKFFKYMGTSIIDYMPMGIHFSSCYTRKTIDAAKLQQKTIQIR